MMFSTWAETMSVVLVSSLKVLDAQDDKTRLKPGKEIEKDKKL